MKLRNKKTGEIHEITEVVPLHDMDKKFVIYSQTEGHNHAYKNLAELNEEWEDYEEPKEYWYIDADGEVLCEPSDNRCEFDNNCREIGNYFETEEEAEQAVEKLKAWKRLRDKGFRFTLTPGVGSLDVNPGKFQIEINADMPAKWFCCDGVQEDLDACFGGEE